MAERAGDLEPLLPEEELFATWLARAPGSGADFDSFLTAHAEQAEGLRRCYANWRRFEGVLGRAGLHTMHIAPGAASRPAEPRLEPRDPPPAQPRPERYRLEGRIAHGAMGAILRVFDRDLRRTLAMKVILEQAAERGENGTPPVEEHVLARFLEEAKITSQLDHPGIVPVHELGIDSQGRTYFTMKLVHGHDLRTVFGRVFTGQAGWNEARALGVLLKVCEAVAYAHTKGVIHRDLKPDNVMVGDFGEVYVMDWGLARVLDRADTRDVRIQPQQGTDGAVKTEREEQRVLAPDSSLVTMDGEILGTPAYMPPEQARGEVERLGPWSDVYAVGAMLYHFLARRAPHSRGDGPTSAFVLLRRVIEGPPPAILELRPNAPRELVAICDKAMARRPEERYPTTLALADDLRAYLEGRVVAAHDTGLWAQGRKWVARNRRLATSLAAVVALLLASAGLWRQVRAEAVNRQRAQSTITAQTVIEAFQNLQVADLLADQVDAPRRAQEYVTVLSQYGIDLLRADPLGALHILEPEAGAVRRAFFGTLLRLGQHLSASGSWLAGIPKVPPWVSGPTRKVWLQNESEFPELAALCVPTTTAVDSLALDPWDRSLWEAWLAWWTKREDRCEELLASSQNPERSGAELEWLAELVAEARGTKAAIPLFEGALELDPGLVWSVIRLRSRRDVAQDSVDAYVKATSDLSEKGHLEDWIRTGEEGAERYPDNPELRFNLGRAYQDAGRLQDALAQFEHAATMGGAPAWDAHANAGAILQLIDLQSSTSTDSTRAELALAHYRQAYELRPDDPRSTFNMAAGLMGVDRVEEGIGFLERTMELDPHYDRLEEGLHATLAGIEADPALLAHKSRVEDLLAVMKSAP